MQQAFFVQCRKGPAAPFGKLRVLCFIILPVGFPEA